MNARSFEGYRGIDIPTESGSTRVLAREGGADLLSTGIGDPESLVEGNPPECWISGGRVPHPVIRVRGELWLVKSYRRGGLLRHWNRSLYCSSRRFYRELEVCIAASDAGVPTVMPIAFVFKQNYLGCLRAWQVTSFIPSTVTLSDVLRARPSSPDAEQEARAAFRSAGDAVRRMHRAGIDHPDLNLSNLLFLTDTGTETESEAETETETETETEWRARLPTSRSGGTNRPKALDIRNASAAGKETDTETETDTDTETDTGTDTEPSGADRPRVLIVDWDRAFLRAPGGDFAHRNLLRLFRSGLKLQPNSAWFGVCCRQFLRSYFRGDRSGLRRLRLYYRRWGAAALWLHRCLWRDATGSTNEPE